VCRRQIQAMKYNLSLQQRPSFAMIVYMSVCLAYVFVCVFVCMLVLIFCFVICLFVCWYVGFLLCLFCFIGLLFFLFVYQFDYKSDCVFHLVICFHVKDIIFYNFKVLFSTSVGNNKTSYLFLKKLVDCYHSISTFYLRKNSLM
jgi:hypothetical protein